MRIRVLASPPLFVPAKGVEYAIDVSTANGLTCISARPCTGDSAVVFIARAEHEEDDLRLAWREGVDVSEEGEAQEFVQALVKMGLAEEVAAASPNAVTSSEASR